jgi:hypothetical protein
MIWPRKSLVALSERTKNTPGSGSSMVHSLAIFGRSLFDHFKMFISLEKLARLCLLSHPRDFTPHGGANMPKSKSHEKSSVEDIRGPLHIFIPCGEEGHLAFPQNINFTAPPANSPNAGRLVLATATAGGITVKIDLKNHRVDLKITKSRGDKELLIRIPIGVRLFKILDDPPYIYYETAEGYNVVPLHFKKGKPLGLPIQQLVLAVSPVPPSDAKEATHPLSLPELSPQQLTNRQFQDGLIK